MHTTGDSGRNSRGSRSRPGETHGTTPLTRRPRHSSPTVTCCSPSPTRCSDRRPTPRTSSRKPGCDGTRSTRRRCATSAPTWSGSPPGSRSTGCAHEAPQGGVRRPLAARAAAHRAGRGRGRRARRECVDGADARPGDAVADRARRLRAREAFDVGYDEIAAAVGKTPPPSARSPTAPAGTSMPAALARWSPEQTRAAVESFQRAIETRDLQGLLDVLAPEVVLMSDGGGIKQAALRPIIGAEKVARLIVGGSARSKARSPVNPPRSTATRHRRTPGRGDSTASWRSVSRTPASPASTSSATRRS